MLHRLVRVILGNRSVILVMMRLPLPVQDGMGHGFRLCKCDGLASDGESLAKRREQDEDEGKPAAHSASLAEGPRGRKFMTVLLAGLLCGETERPVGNAL